MATTPSWTSEFALTGPSGEPIDLWRTIVSHGVTSLPPMRVDEEARLFEVTLPVAGDQPRTVTVTEGTAGLGIIRVNGRPPNRATRDQIVQSVRHLLRLDDDLADFYAAIAGDPELAWAAAGAGRMIRGLTVFEDVVKTICTTNCAWSATVRMVNALVAHLGEPAPDAPASGHAGRAFPTAAAMAAADEAFYRDVVRAGYRGRYMIALAQSVVSGDVDLEFLGRATPEELSDDEVARCLLALPGVGPYAAAHIMLLLGRSSRLILDSWTRPTYARLVGVDSVSDAAIEERFRRYGRHAGLAFWLFVTRDWA
jgi:N-glycosylase/DNA lyase